MDRVDATRHRLLKEANIRVLLLFIFIVPLASPERNLLIRQALTPVLLMRLTVLMILGLWLLRVFVERKIAVNVSVFLILFLAFTVVGVVANSIGGISHICFFGDSKAAFRGISFSLCTFVLVVAAYNYATEYDLKKLVNCLTCSVSLVSLLGILQYFGLAPLFFQSGRVYSTLINPLELAGFIVLTLPLLITDFLWKTEGIMVGATRKTLSTPSLALASIPIILAVVCMLLTFSRSGIAVMLLMLALFLIGYSVKKAIRLLPVVGIALLIYSVILVVPVKTHKTSAAFISPNDTLGGTTSSLTSRLSTWRVGLKMITAKPVLGWGDADLANQFRTQADLQYARELGSDFAPFDLHNRFVTVTAASGIVGLVLFLLILGTLAWKNRVLLITTSGRSKPEVREVLSDYRRALFFGILGLLLHWQLAPSWVATEVLFWVFVACLFGMEEKEAKKISLELKVGSERLAVVWAGILAVTMIGALIWEGGACLKVLKAEYQGTVGIDLASRKRYKEGIEKEKDAIKKNRWEADYYGRLGYIYYEQGKTKEQKSSLWKSIVAYKKAIALNPEDPFRYERLVSVYELLNDKENGRYEDELLQWTEIAVKKNPSSIYLGRLLIKLYFAEGKKEEAYTLLKKMQFD